MALTSAGVGGGLGGDWMGSWAMAAGVGVRRMGGCGTPAIVVVLWLPGRTTLSGVLTSA